MKTLICTLNSKYIHSALAPWCLFAACKAFCSNTISFRVLEGTVNENQQKLFEKILCENADVLCFSCYIWNIEKTLSLCAEIKKASPDTVIVLGGPEVAYRQCDVLKNNSFVDYVLSGEGEITLPQLINCLESNGDAELISGISFCKNSNYIIKKEAVSDSFNFPSPYCGDYFDSLNSRIAYIETSRGCPFSCAYCLSGRCGKVKFKDLEQTKKEILLLASSGTKTVKFVDRTFNCNNNRAIEILRFIRKSRGCLIPKNVCFHFEINADILNQSFIDEVALAEKGSVQFEIGIQSLNEQTLETIGRKSNKEKLFSNIKKLLALGNCHIHTDLIAGLPFESYESFINGFNQCYNLKANMLQLGFLKKLYGSPMDENSENFPSVHQPFPPYEVISTSYITETELNYLRLAESALDRLHNSGRFTRTLDYILSKSEKTPFDIFLYIGLSVGRKHLPLDSFTDEVYAELIRLNGINSEILRDKMIFDRLACNNSGIIPKSLYRADKRLKKVKTKLNESYPVANGVNRCTAILYTSQTVIFSDYSERDSVTGEYTVNELPFEFFGKTFFDFNIDK